MKRIALILICITFAKTINAQTQTWKTTLNNIPPGDASDLGTDNDTPLNLITNGARRIIIDQDGYITFNTLAGSGGSRFLQVDDDGVLSNWEGSLIDENKILFGNNTWKVYPFTTTGSNVSIPGAGKKFGIGISSPNTELDVLGSGNFSGNLKLDGILTISDITIQKISAVGSNPTILQFGGNPQQGLPWVAPCNASWQPPSAQTFPNIIQIHGNTSVINLGTESLGDGVISVEPITLPGSQKLKLNPSCNNDVEICAGGGFTKIYNNASIGGKLKIGSASLPAPSSQLDISVDPTITKAVRIMDPNLTTTNKNIFEMSKNGETVLGVDLSPVSGAMLTIGQPQYNLPGISLIYSDPGSTHIPVFNVYGDGLTEIKALGNQAVSIIDYNNSQVFSINADGKTYVKGNLGIGVLPSTSTFLNINAGSNTGNADLFSVGSSGAPNAIKINYNGVTTMNVNGTTGSVFKIKNQSTDLFAVQYDGVAYAREVVVTLTAFPDYVFSEKYDLLKLKDVKSYVKENKRLPNMPSAKEVKENGAHLGELQRLTVEKVEELYLYVFQLEEKIEALNNQIKLLEKK